MMADETTGSADMAENAEAPQDTGASVANTEAANSTPDLTPSRRSSRKKQSTFSSDFEYYTPTGRKKELKDDELRPSLTNQVKPAGKGKKKGKQPSNDEGQEGEGEEDEDEGGKRKPMKRKVAVRKQQGAADAEDESEKESVKPKAGKGKLKVAVKKKKAKGAAVAKKKTKESEEMEEGSEEEEESSGEESVASSTAKGQKRKKNPVKAGNKRAKADKKDEEEEEEESSDEEESTPISQLKAQMKQQKPVEKPVTVSSPLAQNLVKKLMEASTDTGSSPEKTPVAGQKRKLVSGSEDDEEVPLKKLQTPKLVQIEKLAPALAGLVKRLPPSDLGLVKRSPSEIAAKTSATQKKVPSDSTVSKATEKSDSQESLNTNSEPKPVSKVEEVSQTHKRPVENEKKAKVSTLKMPGVKDVKKPEGGSTTGGKTKAVGKAVKVESGIKKLSKDGQIIKNSDNAEWKKKISDLKGKVMQREGIKVKAGAVKGGEKLLSGVAKQKLLLSKQKLQTSELKSKSLSKKADEKSVSILKQKKVGHIHSKGDGVKVQEGMTKIGQGDGQKIKKPSLPIKNVDDLLKRGIVHKKKSHQPFGNKKTVTKIVGKDLKTEVNKDVKPEELKKKPGVQKSEEKGEIKKPKDRERKKSSEALKHGRDRSHSSDSGKGERRKSSEGGKKSEKSSKVEDEDKKPSTEDGPPPLLPVSATAAKHRHKHPKPEHEVPMDMTMMDLFKPDGLIVHDQQKKEEAGSDGKPVGSEDRKSQYTSEAYDPESYVKPENAHHVLIEHQYSKPSSPVTPKQETQKNVGTSAGTGRNDDIESVSHKQTVIMDMNLPDQILEESEEPVVEESADGLEETWPDNMEELQQRVSKASSGDRSSILESLDTELKESGTEFRIVGQVEVGRASLGSPEENVFTSLMSSISSQIPKDTKEGDKKKKDGEKSVSVRKVSTEARKSSTEKRRDSGEKRKDSTEKRTDKQSSSSEKSKGSTVKSKHHKTSKTDGKGGGGPGGKEEDDESDEHPFEDDENDEDWEPNDSDALYCLCKKPHNNRFMICCDKCEEWFHGTCVGITRARGKEMEDNEEEYICPVCAKQGGSTSAEKPGSPAVSKTTESPSPAKPKLQQKCIGRKCNKTPRPGSVYCSNECIMSHAQESLKAIREEQIRKKAKEKHHSSSPSTKSQSQAPSGETVEVVERQSGKVLKGSSAPTPKGLHQWLEQHPTFEVVQPHKHRSSSSTDRHRDKDSKSDRHSKSTSEAGRKMSSDSDRDRKSDRDDKSRHGHRSRHSSTGSKDSGQRSDSGGHRSSTSQRSESTSSNSSKADEKKEDGPNQIRINVRSALRDSLTARAHDADDIMLSSTEIKSLAVTIEEELFSLFSDTGHKYRTKYRSLIFNIKDQKNKGLFRKILTGKIKPHKLVQMSTEELASRELAKWREQESKHQLEMIEKTEQEALKESESAKHVRKKTHKGEVEVEDEDLSILESRVEERKDPEPEPLEEQANAPVIDTTDQHRAHLFDLNCKVCTGKIVPGPEEQAAAAAAHKMKVAHLQSYEEEREEEETSGEKEDFEKAEEIVKEALRHVQKTEKEVSSLPKIVSSSPAPEEPPPPLSPKAPTPRRESTSSTSSASSIPSKKKVVVRSPDSALQSGLEAKPKFTPTGPVLWKGFVSMLDVAKFFTSAYKVSGPTDHITIPDTVHIMGRISPDHMWDYLSKIRQAGSKDLTVIRFIPGSDDEKVAYVHLYSYLNSRGRCGVAGNPNKQIKDFYIVPLASHSRIPRTLLPFDGPGLEENRPHMLIGILVRQRGKHGSDTSDTGSTGSGKSSSQSNSTTKKSGTQPVSRDPRLAKLAAAAAKEASPAVSPPESSSSSTSSTGDVKPKTEEYEPEYVPMPVKAKTAHKPVVEYIPTPTVKKKDKSKETAEIKTEQKTPTSDDSSSSKDSKEKHHHHHKDHHHHHHDHHHPHHHHHHHHHKKEKPDEMEDDSEPYSPGKEAEPYSPGQEAAADEPYDPGDESLMDEDGIPVMSTNTSTPAASSVTPLAEAVVATMTATSAAPTVSALSSSVTAAAEQSALLNISATQKETSNSIAELVERMARSNDPQEISSLMVTALSTANSPQEQQKLLVDLTKQVEDRKLQLAEAARKESTGLGSGGLKLDEKQKSGESGGGLLGMSSTEKSLASVVGGEVVRGLVAAGIAASVPASSAAVTATVSAGVDNTAISTGAPGGVLSSSSSSATKSEQDQTVSSSSASSTVSSSLSTTALSNVWFSGMSSSKNSDTTNSSVSDIPIPPSSSSSSSSSTLPTSAAPDTSTSGASTSGSKDSGVIKFSFTKTLAKPSQILSSQTANVFSTETMDTKPLPRLDDDSTQQASKLDTNDSSSVKSGDTASSQPGAAGSSTEIPDALKALMNDVMGNTQFSSLERRRKMLMKKEAEKAERAAKEAAKEEQDAKERLSAEEQNAEAQKRLDDEMEARRILDSIKKTESSGGTSSTSTVTPAGDGGEPKAEPAEAKPTSAPTAAPSIDELLDRLKKGGFQFPIQKTESTSSGTTTSTATTTVSGTSSSSSTTPSLSAADSSPFSTTAASSSSVLPSVAPGSSTGPVPSTTSVESSMDVDLRQIKSPAAASIPSTAAATNVASTGSTDSKPTRFGDFDSQAHSNLQDRDERSFCQDRDERLYRPLPPSLPKHPLDPHAFPPLPVDPRGYPSVPHPPPPLPPPPHGPLHPRFPLPSADPHVSYHPTPRASLGPRPLLSKGRAQPPPPGTEFDKPAGVLGITNDFPPSDVDMRSRNRPPLPPDQPPPPLPPQPPPPLPPLPGNRGPPGGHYPHPPPGDMDFRTGDPYGPRPPPHHSDYQGHHGYPGHGRGGGRPYHRH